MVLSFHPQQLKAREKKEARKFEAPPWQPALKTWRPDGEAIRRFEIERLRTLWKGRSVWIRPCIMEMGEASFNSALFIAKEDSSNLLSTEVREWVDTWGEIPYSSGRWKISLDWRDYAGELKLRSTPVLGRLHRRSRSATGGRS